MGRFGGGWIRPWSDNEGPEVVGCRWEGMWDDVFGSGGNGRESKVTWTHQPWSDNAKAEVVCGRWKIGLQVIKGRRTQSSLGW